MRLAAVLLSLSLSTGCAYAGVPVAHIATPADPASLDTPFTVRTQTQVPGKVLAAGSYIITIKDHLSDRAILEIKREDGKLATTFLGVFNPGAATKISGPIILPTDKGNTALRGFVFAGGRTIEFVYPKAEAAEIANRTSSSVLAIDPPSDNLKVNADNSLSNQDAQIVTLWSLQATRVSPTEKGISAKKWVAQPAQEPTVAAVPAKAPASSATSALAKAPATSVFKPVKSAAPAGTQVAANRVPALKALPHTASNMPFLLLTCVLSLMAAAGFRVRRTLSTEK